MWWALRTRAVEVSSLRSALARSLPDYMVPAAFVVWPQLPLTPNGKLDRKALPAPELGADGPRRAPRSPQEDILCTLFAELLGLERVGIDDNFFELGGDSIVSIQLVSRARKAGLIITPREVFQHQTVEHLAAVAKPTRDKVSSVPDVPAGPLPLTPIMCWLRDRGGPIDRFNQSTLLQLPMGMQGGHLIAALQAILDHHDALRLRVLQDGADWALEIAPAGGMTASTCSFGSISPNLDAEAVRACIAEHVQAAEGRLDPKAGVMLQAVWFDAGQREPGRLLLVIHHLAIDGVSWRILVPDLAAAWQAAKAGHALVLPPRGTSFRRWAQHLTAHARGTELGKELPFWTTMLGSPVASLIDGTLDPGRDVAETARHLTVTLPASITTSLLTTVPAAFHGRINDVLLTALVLAIADWRRVSRPAQTVLCSLISRAMAARRSSKTSTCRAPSGGSPACSRSGSIPVRSIWTRP